MQNKKELRKYIFGLRDNLAPREIASKSERIAQNLRLLPAYRRAHTVMFFLSFRSEVDTRGAVEECISLGKKVVVPKALPETRELQPSLLLDWERDLEPGAYDIPEPRQEALREIEPGQIDLLIVPGVAFDESGNRLGYGGGYYDRFFALLRPEVPLVALVFDLQIVPAVPVDEWDRRVDWIVTEERVLYTGSR